jgi:hypothetical protein
MYITSLECNRSFHELRLECRFDDTNAGGPGILARGLYLVGATWDTVNNVLAEGDRQNICHEMPVFRLVPVPDEGSEISSPKTFSCPVFQVNTIKMYFTALFKT